MYYVVFILPFIISAFVCYYVAKERGASTSFWTAMGAIFGPLAIPFVFFSKSNK